jgi:hypothetical protein
MKKHKIGTLALLLLAFASPSHSATTLPTVAPAPPLPVVRSPAAGPSNPFARPTAAGRHTVSELPSPSLDTPLMLPPTLPPPIEDTAADVQATKIGVVNGMVVYRGEDDYYFDKEIESTPAPHITVQRGRSEPLRGKPPLIPTLSPTPSRLPSMVGTRSPPAALATDSMSFPSSSISTAGKNNKSSNKAAGTAFPKF